MVFWIIAVPVFFFGLILGSFSTALTWRIPRGISIIHQQKNGKGEAARSACPHCKHMLAAYDLIPVFSWLSTKGKCRYCETKIGVVYPLIELSCGLGALGLYAAYGLTVQAVLLSLLLPFLMAMVVIDLRQMILPDKLTLACVVIGLGNLVFLYVVSGYDVRVLAHYGFAALFYAAFSWILAFLVSKILKRDAMGMGDVKFFFVAGLFLGFPYFSTFLILSGVCGVSIGLVWQKLSGSKAFPFGPALILSLYACLVLQGLGIVPFVGV